MKKRLLSVFISLTCIAAAQQAAPKTATAPPIYVLYRMMFRHLAELDASASARDAAQQPGGAQLRTAIQTQLRLPDADAAAFRAGASACLQQLDAEDAKASQAVSSARASIQAAGQAAEKSAVRSAALTQLNDLEEERTRISRGCIESLRASLSPKAFGAIDLYVRTVVANHTMSFKPPFTPPTAPLSAGAEKQ